MWKCGHCGPCDVTDAGLSNITDMQQQQQQHRVNAPQNVGGVSIMSPSTVAIAQPSVVESYNGQQSIALGITLIVCAVLSFTFNAVDLAVGLPSYEITWGVIGHGFWVGLMSLIAGGFGIGAGCSKTVCKIVTFNVMCILTAAFTIGQFTVGLMGAIIGNGECYSYYYVDCTQTPRVMEILLAIFAVIEAVSAIWGSAICCKAYCCCRTIPVSPVFVSMDNGVPIMVIMNQQQAASVAHSSANMYAYAPPTPYNALALPGGLPSYSLSMGLLQQQQAAGSFDQLQGESVTSTINPTGPQHGDEKHHSQM